MYKMAAPLLVVAAGVTFICAGGSVTFKIGSPDAASALFASWNFSVGVSCGGNGLFGFELWLGSPALGSALATDTSPTRAALASANANATRETVFLGSFMAR